jgi:hypothetical protein
MFKITTLSVITHHDSSAKTEKDQALQTNLSIILVQNIGQLNTADVFYQSGHKKW